MNKRKRKRKQVSSAIISLVLSVLGIGFIADFSREAWILGVKILLGTLCLCVSGILLLEVELK